MPPALRREPLQSCKAGMRLAPETEKRREKAQSSASGDSSQQKSESGHRLAAGAGRGLVQCHSGWPFGAPLRGRQRPLLASPRPRGGRAGGPCALTSCPLQFPCSCLPRGLGLLRPHPETGEGTPLSRPFGKAGLGQELQNGLSGWVPWEAGAGVEGLAQQPPRPKVSLEPQDLAPASPARQGCPLFVPCSSPK